MVNLMIGESAGFSTLTCTLMKSKYRSKFNVETTISSLMARFEKMSSDIATGSSIPQIIGCRYFAKCTFTILHGEPWKNLDLAREPTIEKVWEPLP